MQLMEITVGIGLAQNFGALRSLVTSGIQKGHMKMHLMNIPNQLNATEEEREAAKEFFKNETVSFNSTREFLEQKRNSSILNRRRGCISYFDLSLKNQKFTRNSTLLWTWKAFTFRRVFSILDGADGLALPTKAGQSMSVRYESSFSPKLCWKSRIMAGNVGSKPNMNSGTLIILEIIQHLKYLPGVNRDKCESKIITSYEKM